MKILINTASTLKGGGIQVALSFLNECIKFGSHEYYVILGDSISKLIDQEKFPPNFRFFTISFRPATRVFSVKSHDLFFRNIERQYKPDVVFTTTGPSYWRPKVPHLIGYNLGHHIYPESPYFKIISPSRRLRWRLKKLVALYFFKRDADALVVQTRDVQERVKKVLNIQDVYVVSNTISEHYLQQRHVDRILPERKPDEFRFLLLSAWYPHKNFGLIKGVLDQLPDIFKNRIKFILTLPESIFREKFEEQYRGFIYNVGPLPVEQGPGLYKESDAMFLPTLVECFSASYAEAMATNKPILTSDLGFAKTVCDDAAIYFDPMSVTDTIEKIKLVMDSREVCLELIRKGEKRLEYFGTSEERASQYLKILEALGDA